jgi:hypothetical protein
VIPLRVQVQIALGATNVFITPDQHAGVHECIAMLLDMGSLLHLVEYTTSSKEMLQLTSRRLLHKLKRGFSGY